MSAQHQDDDIDRDVEKELVRRLVEAEAEHRPAEVTLAGRRYRLVPIEEDRMSAVTPGEDPFRNYDPRRAREALAAGALEGLDVDAFLEEIMESRVQDTPGRRWP